MESSCSAGFRHTAVRLLAAACLVVAIVVTGVTAAGAKGPTPVIGEPENGLTVGEAAVIPIAMEWPPGSEDLAVSNPDFWGDEVPWTLFVRESGAPEADAVPLAFRHVGPDLYVVDFTPPTEGDWVLNVGTTSPDNSVNLFPGMQRALGAEPPPGPGIPLWPFVAGVVLVAIAAVTGLQRHLGRRRNSLAAAVAA
jgi:hypothetical protein